MRPISDDVDVRTKTPNPFGTPFRKPLAYDFFRFLRGPMNTTLPTPLPAWCRKELAHVLMHDPDDEEVRQHRGIREVEAESVALMIGAAHGMDTAGYTIPYVSTWAARVDGQEPVQVVQATGERVRKTALAILDQLDTIQVGDGTPPDLERDIPSPRTSYPAARAVEADRPRAALVPELAGRAL